MMDALRAAMLATGTVDSSEDRRVSKKAAKMGLQMAESLE